MSPKKERNGVSEREKDEEKDGVCVSYGLNETEGGREGGRERKSERERARESERARGREGERETARGKRGRELKI